MASLVETGLECVIKNIDTFGLLVSPTSGMPTPASNTQIRTIWLSKSLLKWKELFISAVIRIVGFKNITVLIDDFLNILNILVTAQQGWFDDRIYHYAYNYVQYKLYQTPEWKQTLQKSQGVRQNRRIQEISQLLGNFKLPATANYLDVGCSEGSITSTLGHYFNLSNQNIHGCDVTQVHESSESWNFKLITDETLPYDSNSMEFISVFMALHHIRDPANSLKEIHRILKPGGMLLVREHDAGEPEMGLVLDLLHGFYSMVWPVYSVEPGQIPEPELESFKDHYSHYRSRQQWNTIITSQGFKLAAESNVQSAWRYYYDVYQKN